MFRTPPLIPHARSFCTRGLCAPLLPSTRTPASTSWQTNNLILYIPIIVPTPVLVKQFWLLNGASVSGNWAMGLYSKSGTRLAQTGTVGQLGTSDRQIAAATTPTIIPAGLYYLALQVSTTGATVIDAQGTGSAVNSRAIGVLAEAAGSFGLPATATFAAPTVASYPICGFDTYGEAPSLSTPIWPMLPCLTPFSLGSIGPSLSISPYDAGTSGWLSTNRAFYFPLHVSEAVEITKVFRTNGNQASGNYDIGLYDAACQSRLFSIGSTGNSGTLTLQITDVSDFVLPQGDYYLAMVCDNTTSVINRANGGLGLYSSTGILQEDSAFPLPATATPVQTVTTGFVPLFGLLQGRTTL